MIILDVITVPLLFLLLLAGGYYFILLLVRLTSRAMIETPCQNSADDTNLLDFLVLIPAHNEANVIARTLQSVLALDYPAHKFDCVVIADNCSDRTVEITNSFGVRCLERNDLDRHGKDWALVWAFDQIRHDEWDSLLIVDADCTIDTQALRVINDRMLHGATAIQIDIYCDL
jgi:cellulose synthase/poly-beta-1,6-N-acetylglucosamine synthase-like glycosyltransferase